MAAVSKATASGPFDSTTNQKSTNSAKLEDQAATAALLATGHGRQKSRSGQEYLDKNHKLSSAGKCDLRD